MILIIGGLLLVILSPASAQTYNESVKALNQSRIDLQEMIDSEFNVLRVRDILNQAGQLFEAQYALMQAGGTPDFSLVVERTEEITDIAEQAYEVNYELKAFEELLKEVGNESEAFALYAKAKQEFADERYDKVSAPIEEAYVKLREKEALETRFRAIYTASTQTVTNTLKKNLKKIFFGIAFIVALYYLTRKKITIVLINRKIGRLNFEKQVLQKLIKTAQYEYFHAFKIPEELYHIRITKFGELIRDIDRKVPLLVEDRERIKGTIKQNPEVAKPKKLSKKIGIAVVLVVAAALLAIYFNLISYGEIIEPIQKNYRLVSAVVILVLVAGAGGIYIKKRGESKKIVDAVRSSVAAQINRVTVHFKNLVKNRAETKQRTEVLKQKTEEEKLRANYLRKQKLLLVKRNAQKKISSIFKSISQSKPQVKKVNKRQIKRPAKK